MYPELFHLGAWSVGSYGLALALSFALGIALARRRARRRGLDGEAVLEVSLWILVAALLGSRLLHVALHLEQFRPPLGTPLDVVNPFHAGVSLRIAGLSVMGGLPAAAVATWVYLRRRRLPVLVYMDLLAPSVALGAAITRVGCFLNGCCFGRVTGSALGVHYPDGSLPQRLLGDAALHPTPLYQSGAALAIFALLLVLARRAPFRGAVVFSLLALMGLQRLLIEWLRHSPEAPLVLDGGGLALNLYQGVALGVATAGVAGLARCAARIRLPVSDGRARTALLTRMLLVLLLFLPVLVECDDGPIALSVDIRSPDLLAADIPWVQGTMKRSNGSVYGTDGKFIPPGTDLTQNYRIGDWGNIEPGRYRLDVKGCTSSDCSVVVAETPVDLDLREDFAVTVVLMRNTEPPPDPPAAPLLEVTKWLSQSFPYPDLDGDGEFSTGDTALLDVEVKNVGASELAGVVYQEVVDWIFQGQMIVVNPDTPQIELPGAPPTTNGVFVVTEGSQQILTAYLGTLATGESAYVYMEVLLAQAATLSQGEANDIGGEVVGAPRIRSDDPNAFGFERATLVPITPTGIDQCRTDRAAAEGLYTDSDGDGLTDAEEEALGTDGQTVDSDGDTLDDRAEFLGPDGVPGTGDETDPLSPDTDGDGLFDTAESCPLDADPSDVDSDGDGVGDACDSCPLLWNAAQADADGDGVGDVCDNCRLTANPSQLDRDGFDLTGPDGTGDACANGDLDLDGGLDVVDVMRARRQIAGLPPGSDVAVPLSRGCAPGVPEQAFAFDMRGCHGAVLWADRQSLCAPDWFACSAAQWVARRGGVAPTANYWTGDDLRFSGSSDACWVDESVGTQCIPGQPMRVCAATSDYLGNTCNWTGCGYQSAPPPNEYFGGCYPNATAGTLCCF